jgi:hypothetical protein
MHTQSEHSPTLYDAITEALKLGLYVEFVPVLSFNPVINTQIPRGLPRTGTLRKRFVPTHLALR